MPNPTAPQDFLTALESLKGHEFRPEIHVTQVPPPQRIAPWAVALQAEVNLSPTLDPDSYRGNTRFVLLYDPQDQPAWNGPFRIVTYTNAPVDSDMGGDPLLGEVAWSWLTDSLNQSSYHSLSGTVTRNYNESFGENLLLQSLVDLEIRASWSPSHADISSHLRAWANFASIVCGLAPEGTYALPRVMTR